MRPPTVTNPRWFLSSVVALSVLSACLGGLLVLRQSSLPVVHDGDLIDRVRGPLLHTSLQSIGACLALITALLAFVHSSLFREQTTAVVGAALLFAGLIDAYHIVLLDHFVSHVEDEAQFGPFTWSLSRIFHATIIALGTGPLAWGRGLPQKQGRREKWLLILASAIMAMGTFSIILVCANVEDLPDALRPGSNVPRPLDALALSIYLLAGGVLLPRFYQRYPSLFSYGLLLSLIPHILGELFAAFGSRQTYDTAFMVAQWFKLIGYSVPLVGLLIDYTRVYRAEGELRGTQEKLRVAREIQQGLIPLGAPDLPGYEVSGLCIPTDAVGGDFYDYVPMPGGKTGIVIADVSGHDLGAAILMSQTRAYLRAEAGYLAEPAVLLSRINQFLCRDVRDRRFISLFLAVVDPAETRIRYAAAGHHAYILSPSGEVMELKSTGPVLGVIETEYEEGPPVELAPGSTLILITDGWPEATAPAGEAFQMRRVFETLMSAADQTPAERLERLHRKILDFRWQQLPEDDLTAVLLQRPLPGNHDH